MKKSKSNSSNKLNLSEADYSYFYWLVGEENFGGLNNMDLDKIERRI